MLFPNRTKFKKTFKGSITGNTIRGSKIIYGDFALKSLENNRITSKQIEAARRAITRKMKRLGYLWIRIYPCVPITSKGKGSRMGKGKGSVDHWVFNVKSGQILFEICGVSLESAKNAFKSGSNKLPVKTKFIQK